MYLELAEDGKQGYTYVPFDDGDSAGAYVKNDILAAAQKLVSTRQPTLNGFFGDLWSGIKEVGKVAVNSAGAYIGIKTTGGNMPQYGPQQPPIIIPPRQGMDTNTMILIGAGLVAVLMLKK